MNYDLFPRGCQAGLRIWLDFTGIRIRPQRKKQDLDPTDKKTGSDPREKNGIRKRTRPSRKKNRIWIRPTINNLDPDRTLFQLFFDLKLITIYILILHHKFGYLPTLFEIRIRPTVLLLQSINTAIIVQRDFKSRCSDRIRQYSETRSESAHILKPDLDLTKKLDIQPCCQGGKECRENGTNLGIQYIGSNLYTVFRIRIGYNWTPSTIAPTSLTND